MSSEVGVRLTGDNSEYKGMLDDSEKKTENFAGKIADKVGDKIYGVRDLGTAVATALGLNLEHIAQNIARFFTGMSKDEEEAWKKIDALSTQVADASIKNMRAMMTEENKYALALQERDKLIRQIDAIGSSSGVSQLKSLELQAKLQEKITEIQALENKQKEEAKKLEEEREKKFQEAVKERVEWHNKEFQARVSVMETTEKIAALIDRIDITEGAIRAGLFQGVALEEKRKELEQLRLQVIKETGKAEQDNSEQASRDNARELNFKKELADADEKQATKAREAARLLLKDKEDLTGEEKIRLQVLRGEVTQEEINAEIVEKTIRLMQGSLTPEEQARLRLLTGQVVAARAMTDELKAQGEKLNSFEETLGVSLGMMIQFRSQSAFASTSDEVLKEMLKRNKEKIDALTNPFSPNYAPVSSADVVTGHLQQKLEAAGYALENTAIQDELNSRQGLRKKSFTEALGDYKGDLLQFDELFAKANSAMMGFAQTQNATNALLTSIAHATAATAAGIGGVSGQLGSAGLGAPSWNGIGPNPAWGTSGGGGWGPTTTHYHTYTLANGGFGSGYFQN